MKITIVVENRTNDYRCWGEHGLSLYVDTGQKKILFDTGASSLVVKNSRFLGIALETVDAVVISHGHYDHGGGIQAFCEKNPQAPVYVHKKAFGNNFGTEHGEIEEEDCGLALPNPDILAQCYETDDPVWLDENIVVSGTIPKEYGSFSSETFYRKDGDGFQEDPMDHEQFLAIHTDQGIVLFSGCSHKGVEPAMGYVKKLMPDTPIHAVFAGLHLMGATEQRIEEVCQAFEREGVKEVIPLHCTGATAACAIKNRLGQRCILGGVGDQYEY